MKDLIVLDNLTDVLRTLNLVTGIVTLVWLVARRCLKRGYYTDPVRNDMWFIATFWTTALVVGTFEQLYETDTTIRVGFASAALVVTIRLLVRSQSHWDNSRNEAQK